MREIYKKHGTSVRFEQDRLITVREAGEAVEDGGAFFCEPLAPDASDGRSDRIEPMIERVEAAVAAIRAVIAAPLSIERLVVSEGHARNDFGGVQWEETFRRVHLAIVRGEHRAILHLGDFDTAEIARVADAMVRMEPRDDKGELRLAPPVTAALLPSLIGVVPPNIVLMQSAGGRDGKGQVIGEWTVDGAPAPNWFRPSYRVRPRRLPLNVRATCSVTDIDPGLPEAIALLAPPHGLTLQVLCVDGEKAFPATVRISRIDAIAREAAWYPFAAGSFGSEMAVF